jgi:hypothetical protein
MVNAVLIFEKILLLFRPKHFQQKKQAEQWAAEIEANIDSILEIKPKKIKKLSPAKVERLGGTWLFQKLGIELEFMTFTMLADEQWKGKDKNQVYRALYWLNTFNDTPIKSITSIQVKKAINSFANTNCF